LASFFCVEFLINRNTDATDLAELHGLKFVDLKLKICRNPFYP